MDTDKIKRVYKTIMLIIVVALITFIITSVFLYNKLETSSYTTLKINGINSELITKINVIKNIIDSKYITEVKEEKLINSAIKGYVEGTGDVYSEYFTKEEMEEFLTETEGNYFGIGIYMLQNIRDNTVVILTPIKGSPAEKAGLMSGDIIKKVDGVEYTGDDFEKISTYIKGKEGSFVKLTIERDGKELEFEIERKNIDLYPIETEVLENNIGYISISSFDNSCSKEFKDAYNSLSKSNIKSLIIDLRNNGGGIVDEALEIADYILEKDDVILITKDREGNEKIEKSTKKPIINLPIVILTNENTASASEILVAALKEHGKATIVGEKTYGKGVIQELIPLSDGSGIKLTTQEYYTPNRNKINEVGITPDKEVSLPENLDTIYSPETEDDTQLKEAIKILSNINK